MASGSANATETLVKAFRAGRFKVSERLDQGGMKMEALKDQGTLELQRMQGTSSLRYVWKKVDLSSGRSEETETVNIPAGATFQRISTDKSADRVYLLGFMSAEQEEPFRKFFWLQDPDSSKDTANVENMNKYLKDPTAAAPQITTSFEETDLMSRVMSSLAQTNAEGTGGPPPLNAQSFGATAGRSGGALTAEDVQRALAGVGPAGQAGQAAQRQRPLSLLQIIKADDVLPLLEDEQVREELVALLPEGLQTEEELKSTLRSPQFKQSLGALSAALQSENFNTVFANFGLDPRDGAAALNLGDGIGAFLQAVQARADRGKSQDGDKMEEDDFYN